MICNFDKIRTLIFDEGGIYHLQILQRSKDGHDKSSRLVAEWFITSDVHLDFLKPAIIRLCEEYQARAYINLNRKLPEAVIYKMLEGLVDRVKNKTWKPLNLLGHCVDVCNSEYKVWILDVDSNEYDLDLIRSRVEQCKSGKTRNVIDILPTVNGFHILTCPFNFQELDLREFPEVTIYKNNSTLLYAPFQTSTHSN